jgi:hypothetical protein
MSSSLVAGSTCGLYTDEKKTMLGWASGPLYAGGSRIPNLKIPFVYRPGGRVRSGARKRKAGMAGSACERYGQAKEAQKGTESAFQTTKKKRKKRASPDEDDAVEPPEVVEARDEVHAPGGVGLEVLVLDGDLVVAEGRLPLLLSFAGQDRQKMEEENPVHRSIVRSIDRGDGAERIGRRRREERRAREA